MCGQGYAMLHHTMLLCYTRFLPGGHVFFICVANASSVTCNGLESCPRSFLRLGVSVRVRIRFRGRFRLRVRGRVRIRARVRVRLCASSFPSFPSSPSSPSASLRHSWTPQSQHSLRTLDSDRAHKACIGIVRFQANSVLPGV